MVSGKLLEKTFARQTMARTLGKSASQSPLLAYFLPASVPFPAFLTVILLAVLMSAWRPAYARGHTTHEDTAPQAKLLARIPVAPLGYHAPGALYLLSRESFASLDFIDARHLLFTFHENKLLHREQNAPASDDDQMIHALVLALPDGHIVTAADWRMHDHLRYLWPLSGGRFLVRQRNQYWTTDASLQPRAFLRSPTPVLHTEVSPDGKLALIEDAYKPPAPEGQKKLTDDEADVPQAQDALIAMVDVDSKALKAELRTQVPIELPITSSGYVGLKEMDRDQYEVAFYSFQGEKKVLGRVASVCTPRITFLSATALMIASCGPNTVDSYLDAWTIDGRKLWSGRRDGRTAWPTFAVALNGSRFAIGLLQVDEPFSTPDSLYDEDVKGQSVQVFDTNTGGLLLTTSASPVLTAGQNFALSPDGSWFAVLRNGAIEVYQVPSVPTTQRPALQHQQPQHPQARQKK